MITVPPHPFPMGSKLEVWLNGELLPLCLVANTQEQWIERYRVGSDGFVLKGPNRSQAEAELLTERVFGVVEIRVVPS